MNINSLWEYCADAQIHGTSAEWRTIMPKDGQPDNKKARMDKANGQTPLTKENQNKNKNAKRQSIKHNDV